MCVLTDYCSGLSDGLYHDPWNPWCGYVECTSGRAVRHTCARGSWMGMPVHDSDRHQHSHGMTQLEMCRRPMFVSHACRESTLLMNLCFEPANQIPAKTVYFVDPAQEFQVRRSFLHS